MAIKIPEVVRETIRTRVYAAADKANYTKSSRVDNARFLEELCADSSIGGLVAQYIPKQKIRTYIKDAVLNRYTKERKARARPNKEAMINYCASRYQVTNFAIIDEVKDIMVLKSLTSPVFVVLVEGTFLKWESALRKGLLYIAGHPLGMTKTNTVHILLSLFRGEVPVTPADEKLLEFALGRAGASAYLWNANTMPCLNKESSNISIASEGKKIQACFASPMSSKDGWMEEIKMCGLTDYPDAADEHPELN